MMDHRLAGRGCPGWPHCSIPSGVLAGFVVEATGLLGAGELDTDGFLAGVVETARAEIAQREAAG